MNVKTNVVLAVAVAFLVSVIATGTCYAQYRVLDVNIPFSFQVENKTLPAGEYRIESLLTGLHVIRPMDSGAPTIVSTIVPTIEVKSKGGKSEPELIFNRYGESYFLSQIWAGEGKGRQLFKSEREKELMRTKAKVEVALLVHSSSKGERS
jgi:hypothetical protein